MTADAIRHPAGRAGEMIRAALIRVAIPCLLAVLVPSGCGGRGDSTEDAPAPERVDYMLVAVDSIGVEMGDSAYMFGVATSADFAQDGSIVILDDINCTVDFYTPEGEHLRTVDIEGGGPGEFNSPLAVTALPGGGFFIYGTNDRKIAVYDEEMQLVDEIGFTSANRRGPMMVHPLSDSSFVASFYEWSEAGDSVTNSVMLLEGDSETVITSRSAPLDPGYAWQRSITMHFDAASDGSILVSDFSFDKWEIVRYSRDGQALDTLSREHEPVLKSDSLYDAELELARQAWLNAYGTMDGFEITPDEFFPSIGGIQCASEGRVWVRRGRYDVISFDVMSLEGEPLFECRFQPPTWQECFSWNVIISGGGFLAGPFDPELFPLMYRLELVEDDRPATEDN
jgi:hypothetical protein